MEETFKIKSVYVNSKYVRFLYPLLVLGLVIFILSTPYLELTEYAPLILIAVVAWTVYDIYNIKKLKNFFVTLNDNEININDENVLKWEQINSIKYFSVGFGMQGIITFNDDRKIKIPAAIENLELLKNRIEKNLPEGCNVTNK